MKPITTVSTDLTASLLYSGEIFMTCVGAPPRTTSTYVYRTEAQISRNIYSLLNILHQSLLILMRTSKYMKGKHTTCLQSCFPTKTPLPPQPSLRRTRLLTPFCPPARGGALPEVGQPHHPARDDGEPTHLQFTRNTEIASGKCLESTYSTVSTVL